MRVCEKAVEKQTRSRDGPVLEGWELPDRPLLPSSISYDAPHWPNPTRDQRAGNAVDGPIIFSLSQCRVQKAVEWVWRRMGAQN